MKCNLLQHKIKSDVSQSTNNVANSKNTKQNKSRRHSSDNQSNLKRVATMERLDDTTSLPVDINHNNVST